MGWFKTLWIFIEEIFNKKIIDTPMPEPIPVPPVVPPQVVPVPVVPSKYLWDTRENVRHSVRVICDEEGLTIQQKNDLCATVECESQGFNIHAINYNRDKNGKILSIDRGIAQWNDYWHGKEINAEDAMNNPEKSIRLMCKYWKEGQGKQWVCFSKGLYKQFL